MDRQTYKILKKLYSSGYIPFGQFLDLIGCTRDNYRNSLEFEMLSGYVQSGFLHPDGEDGDHISVFSLTPEGRTAVESYSHDRTTRMCSFVAIGISLAALVVSAVALYHSW